MNFETGNDRASGLKIRFNEFQLLYIFLLFRRLMNPGLYKIFYLLESEKRHDRGIRSGY